MTESASKTPPKWVLKTMVAVNVFFYRLTNGKFMGRMKGSPICLVTMKGRKSGREIVMPVMYTEHEGNVPIVASLAGADKNPVWYHNIMANPDIMTQDGARIRKMRARQADAAEKSKLWPVLVASYGEFADYQAKTSRNIPVLICESC